MEQHLLHPIAVCVFLFGTFFLLMSEFDQFLHNKSLMASGYEPDRGISIWDIAAGWLAIVIVTVGVELLLNHEKWLTIVDRLSK